MWETYKRLFDTPVKCQFATCDEHVLINEKCFKLSIGCLSHIHAFWYVYVCTCACVCVSVCASVCQCVSVCACLDWDGRDIFHPCHPVTTNLQGFQLYSCGQSHQKMKSNFFSLLFYLALCEFSAFMFGLATYHP